MWKEDEPGEERINTRRSREMADTKADIVAANCPFCITMLRDGVSKQNLEGEMHVFDLAELVAAGQGIQDINLALRMLHLRPDLII